MSKICPLTNDTVLYLECNDCDEKSLCRQGLLQANKKEVKSNEKGRNEEAYKET